MTSVTILQSETVAGLIASFLALDLQPDRSTSPLVVLSGTTPRSVERALTENPAFGEPVRILRPSRAAADVGRRFRRKESFQSIDVSGRAARLQTVHLPAALATDGLTIVVNDLRAVTDNRPTIAIGLWATIASPWQRIGAKASDPRDGLVAELALAAPPSLYLIIDRIGDVLVGVAGSDMIAVELVSLALRWTGRGLGRDTGPWEDPLIQHATDLELGVGLPEAIEIVVPDGRTESLRSTVIRAADRIGVTQVLFTR